MWRSVPQTLAASTWMRTSWGPGSGTGASGTRVSPGPGASFRMARIVLDMVCGDSLLQDPEMEPAVQVDRKRGRELEVRTGHGPDGPRHVLGFSPPPERHEPLGDPAIIDLPDPPGHVRGDDSRPH